jgi:hypoxanthine phosphoribosyltransferase
MFYPVPWNEVHTLTRQLAREIVDSRIPLDGVVCIARGGLAIANILSDYIRVPVTSFTVSTYRDMKKLARPEVSFGVAPEIEGKHILLLDDIADTGDTLDFGTEYVRSRGAASVTTAALFYKNHSRHTPRFYAKETSAWVIFPFEIHETLGVYRDLASTDPEKARELANSIKALQLDASLLEGIDG